MSVHSSYTLRQTWNWKVEVLSVRLPTETMKGHRHFRSIELCGANLSTQEPQWLNRVFSSQNEFSSWDICFVWDSMVEHSDINIMWFHIHSTVLKYTHKYTHNVLLDSSSATSMRIYLLFYILDNKHNPVPWSPYTRMFNWKYKLQVCIIHLFVSCVKMRVQSRRWEAHWIAHENEVNGKCGGKVPHLCSGCVDEIRWFGLTVLWNFLLSTSISWRSSFFILSI